MFCGIFIYFFSINAPFECILHKSYYIYITIKFHQIFTFFRPFLLHSYNTYYVRVGGAAVSTSNPKGYISTQFEVAAPDAGNDVEVTVDNTTANAFGTTGSSAVIVTATSEIPTGKAVAYDGTPMYYTEYTIDGKTVVKYVALCANFDAEKIALVDGANTKIAYGNLVGDNDYTINGADLNQMINIVLDNAVANEAKLKLIADVNADGSMNGADLNVLINMVLDAAVIPPAATK